MKTKNLQIVAATWRECMMDVWNYFYVHILTSLTRKIKKEGVFYDAL